MLVVTWGLVVFRITFSILMRIFRRLSGAASGCFLAAVGRTLAIIAVINLREVAQIALAIVCRDVALSVLGRS